MKDRFRWAAVFALVLIAAGVGIVSYNAGVSHGLAIAAAAGDAPAGTYMRYGWYRPWGFGVFSPFFFVLFWFLLFRVFFWGGLHRRRWYYGRSDDRGSRFEEWHRRAHEQMNRQSSGQPQGSA